MPGRDGVVRVVEKVLPVLVKVSLEPFHVPTKVLVFVEGGVSLMVRRVLVFVLNNWNSGYLELEDK